MFAHWPGPEGTARPLAWYEHRVRTYVEPTLAGRPTVAELETERGTLVIDLDPQGNATSGLGIDRRGNLQVVITEGAPVEQIADDVRTLSRL